MGRSAWQYFLLMLPKSARAAITKHQGWGGTDNIGLFLTVLGTGKSKMEAWQGWFPLRPPSLAQRLVGDISPGYAKTHCHLLLDQSWSGHDYLKRIHYLFDQKYPDNTLT